MPNYFDAPFEIKSVEETGIFRGYASIFGNKDSHGHIVVAGAFSRTLKENGRNTTGVAMLKGHDTRRPIGVWNVLEEDSRGLKVEGQLILEIQDGRETHALMKAGALKGLSIGYDTRIYKDDAKKKVRYLQDLDLWEISPVVFPSNLRSTITTVKELSQNDTKALSDILSTLERVNFEVANEM